MKTGPIGSENNKAVLGCFAATAVGLKESVSKRLGGCGSGLRLWKEQGGVLGYEYIHERAGWATYYGQVEGQRERARSLFLILIYV